MGTNLVSYEISDAQISCTKVYIVQICANVLTYNTDKIAGITLGGVTCDTGHVTSREQCYTARLTVLEIAHYVTRARARRQVHG